MLSIHTSWEEDLEDDERGEGGGGEGGENERRDGGEVEREDRGRRRESLSSSDAKDPSSEPEMMHHHYSGMWTLLYPGSICGDIELTVLCLVISQQLLEILRIYSEHKNIHLQLPLPPLSFSPLSPSLPLPLPPLPLPPLPPSLSLSFLSLLPSLPSPLSPRPSLSPSLPLSPRPSLPPSLTGCFFLRHGTELRRCPIPSPVTQSTLKNLFVNTFDLQTSLLDDPMCYVMIQDRGSMRWKPLTNIRYIHVHVHVYTVCLALACTCVRFGPCQLCCLSSLVANHSV